MKSGSGSLRGRDAMGSKPHFKKVRNQLLEERDDYDEDKHDVPRPKLAPAAPALVPLRGRLPVTSNWTHAGHPRSHQPNQLSQGRAHAQSRQHGAWAPCCHASTPLSAPAVAHT